MAGELIGGRFRLRERLGAGGMAEVWAAEDEELDRPVAVKLLMPSADAERFRRESRAAAALSHPNVAAIYDYGESDGRPYIVQEFLPGGTLEQRLAPGLPLATEEAEAIALDVAAALAHAHSRGIVHRDVKPANVLFDSEGRAKLADFGIAHLPGSATLTEAGTLLGTAAYLSPEQAAGEPATAASDVYAFGVILYRMLSGRLPFEAGSPLELARMHVDEVPPPLYEAESEAARLAAVTMAALAKSPQARPADGDELLDALEHGVLPPAAPTAVMPRPRPTRRRRRPGVLLPGLAGLALLAAAGAALALVAFDSGSESPETTKTGSTSKPTTARPTTTTQPSTVVPPPTPPPSPPPPPPPPPPPRPPPPPPPPTPPPTPPPPPPTTTTTPPPPPPPTTTPPPPPPPPPTTTPPPPPTGPPPPPPPTVPSVGSSSP